MKRHLLELLEDWTTPLDDGVVFGLMCGFISVSIVFAVFIVIAIFCR